MPFLSYYRIWTTTYLIVSDNTYVIIILVFEITPFAGGFSFQINLKKKYSEYNYAICHFKLRLISMLEIT